jgi:hypothetical protein
LKDQLFLLRPGFRNAGLGPLYCGNSVAVEGLLSFCPDLRTLVDVTYLEFPRPRAALIDALGEDHQAAPVIVLADETVMHDGGVQPKSANGRRFIDDESLIRRYLSTQFDQPLAG